jgi:hypothetical protein
MAYCRFLDADAYFYLDVNGYYTCCACTMAEDQRFYTTDSAIAHLRAHEAAGDRIPDYAFSRLEGDRAENDRWIEEQSIRPAT